MADIVIASAAGGAAQLILERDDGDLLVKAIRVDATVAAELIITMRSGQPITRSLQVGSTRIALSPGRQFVLDDPDTIPVPWTLLEFRAVH